MITLHLARITEGMAKARVRCEILFFQEHANRRKGAVRILDPDREKEEELMGVKIDGAILTTRWEMLRAVYGGGFQLWKNSAVRCLVRMERFSGNLNNRRPHQDSCC